MSKPASSMLALLRFKEQNLDIPSLIGDGHVLWSGHNGFEWIGKGGGEWDSVFLIQYKDLSEYHQAIERFRLGDFHQLKLFEVKPVSKNRRRIVRFLMKHIFSRFSVEMAEEDVDLDDIPQSEILPTKKQMIQLSDADKGYPVVMLNFLKYYENPSYPPEYEGEKRSNGEDAYNQYGKHAMRAVAKLGGVIQNMGEIVSILIGEQDEDWDRFALMQYPSHNALQSMFRMRGTPEAGIQRDAGLKATKVFALTPD